MTPREDEPDADVADVAGADGSAAESDAASARGASRAPWMTPGRALVAGSLALLAVAGVAFGGRLLLTERAARAPASPTVVVQARFARIQDSPGHADHVRVHGVACAGCHALDDAVALFTNVRNSYSEHQRVAAAGDAAGASRSPWTFDAPGAAVCARCHADVETALHDSVLARAATDCLSCHSFGEDWHVRPRRCDRCHDRPQGFIAAVGRHGDQDCGACHRAHARPALEPAACTACHPDERTRHGRGVAGAAQCLDCHRVHEPAGQPSARCASCHLGARRVRRAITPRATFAGHDACATCHRPHEFSRQGALACAGCHPDEHPDESARRRATAAAGKPAAGKPAADAARPGARPRADHGQCASCHPSHDVREADTRCARCHPAIRSDHLLDAMTPAAGASSGSPSSSARGATVDHRGGCQGCHPPHADEPTRPCARCHTEAAAAGFHAGAACTGCHAPHRFTGQDTRDVRCATCHERQRADTASNPGHARCQSCHRDAWHRPRPSAPACARCHPDQRRTAPEGHRDCATCHDTHRARVLPAARCTSCHPTRAADVHIRVRGGCATCHRAHGPRGVISPPTCTVCHDRAAQPGLHALAGHGDCTACHGVHAPARTDRASCARCHRGLENHEPRARVCTGCHVFR